MTLEERLQKHIGEQVFTIAQLQCLLEQANAKIVELTNVQAAAAAKPESSSLDKPNG